MKSSVIWPISYRPKFEIKRNSLRKQLGKNSENKIILKNQEEQAGLNLQKYKQIQLSVDNAEERAQTAENSLARMRSRSRLNVPQQRSSTGLSKSETFA